MDDSSGSENGAGGNGKFPTGSADIGSDSGSEELNLPPPPEDDIPHVEVLDVNTGELIGGDDGEGSDKDGDDDSDEDEEDDFDPFDDIVVNDDGKLKKRRRWFHHQFFALLIKTMQVQRHAIMTNLIIIFSPAAMIIFLLVLDFFLSDQLNVSIADSRNPVKNPVSLFFGIGYYPQTQYVEDVSIPRFDKLSGYLGQTTPLGKAWHTKDELDDDYYYAYDDPTKKAATGFLMHELSENKLNVSVYWNKSLMISIYGIDFIQPEFTNAEAAGGLTHNMIEAYYQYVKGNATYQPRIFGMQEFPRDKFSTDVEILSILQNILIDFLLHLMIPIVAAGVVLEKESGLISYMNLHGMRMPVFWAVNYVYYYIIYCGLIAVFYVMGIIFMELFRETCPFQMILLFLVWGHSVMCQGIFAAALFNSSRFALVITFFAIYINIIMSWAIWISFPNPNILIELELNMIPTSALYRCIQFIVDASVQGDGYTCWKLRFPWIDNVEGLCVLIFYTSTYLLLVGLYLNEVFPSRHRVRRHPLFFFDPFTSFLLKRGYWPKKGMYGQIKSMTLDKVWKNQDFEPVEKPQDVLEEEERLKNLDKSDRTDMIRVQGIEKVYSQGIPLITKRTHTYALKGVSFGIRPKECFGLLGPNGAGKTTLISILTGVVSPNDGSAEVGGYHVSELFTLHTLIGVCPQHDKYWPDLTAKAQLKFFGRLRGIWGKDLNRRVKALMKMMDLDRRSYRRMKVKNYSGGMKRRLSVAMALVGRPSVVYLDEPTVGMDPDARRGIWSVISEASKHMCVVLTTHSMEEADTLCDRIAIVTEGSLRCIGEKAELKSRYGKEYKLIFEVEDGTDGDKVREYVRTKYGEGAKEQEQLGKTLEFEVPRTDVDLESLLTELNEREEELDIEHWGITTTTLDEVFRKYAMFQSH